jgi:hypothetical protein
MNVRKANFEDLISTYYHGTDAHVAAEYLDGLLQGNEVVHLAGLLRDYRERAILAPEEIKLRAATDRLMSCCSALEITSLAGFVSEVRDSEFGLFIRTILENEYVRRYYEEFYPTKLPQLFRFRLAGINRTVEDVDQDGVNSVISAFLNLDRQFMENLEDGIFLRMLDSFTIQGYRFGNLVDIIGQPEAFVERLLEAPEERDVCSRALHEFSLFMQFCFDLDNILARADSRPIIQSAIWNHYGYWFDIIGEELGEQLGKALMQFQTWELKAQDHEAVRAVQTYVNEASAVLKTLTSRQFGAPVDALLGVFRKS